MELLMNFSDTSQFHHNDSIYLSNLVRSMPDCSCPLYLVAPDAREKEVMAQLARPAFREDLADISLAFIPFKDLRANCDALCRFGEDHTILRKVARVPQ
jgi:type II restriction enzyme